MKSCAYCNNILGTEGHKKTDEHIIPSSLLKLYPEQDISIHYDKQYVDNRGMTISDVCSKCNNGVLSELDSYGKEVVEQYFYTPYEFNDYYTPFQVDLEPNRYIRWLLKIVYNSIRCDKTNTQYIKECLPYILGESLSFPSNISVLIGLHINLNPVPEEFFAYTPLQICPSPKFFQNSYMRVKSGEPIKHFIIKGAGQTFAIRIANCIHYIIFWKPTVHSSVKDDLISTLQEDFRFRLLSTTENHYSVRCVSSPTNAIAANYGHFYSETAVQETISMIKSSIQERDIQKAKEEFCQHWTPEMSKNGRAMVEAAMFPNNQKKQKVFDDIYKSNEPE